ncbi:hypothetical protein LTR95_013213 [Oleoguttula sp. CCFEE 5521]
MKDESTRAGQRAACKVFAIPENLSLILLQLNVVELLKSFSVCQQWKQAIESDSALLRALYLVPDFKCTARKLSPHADDSKTIEEDDVLLNGPPAYKILWTLKEFDSPNEKLMQQAFITQPPVQHMIVRIGCCELGQRRSHSHSESTHTATGITLGTFHRLIADLKKHAQYCSGRLAFIAAGNTNRGYTEGIVVIAHQKRCQSFSQLEARIAGHHRDKQALIDILTTWDPLQRQGFSPFNPGPGLYSRAAVMQDGTLARLVAFKP